MLWGEAELATFAECLGFDEEVVDNIRSMRLRGAWQLSEMDDMEMSEKLNLATALERLVLRRSLQQLLESDRWGNSAQGKSFRDVLADPVLGTHIVPIERLKLMAVISEGSFGKVYKAMLLGDTDGIHAPQYVAAKQMKGDNHMQLYEVLKEARVMASIDHPNICRFVGVCVDPGSGRRFILSELMDCSLYSLLHQGDSACPPSPLTPLVYVGLCASICAGLAYIHARKLVHADLKSPNILIKFSSGKRLVPRICDFGHAAVRPVPSPHDRLCTPHWAAPEVLRGEGLSTAADMFSVGVLLWEMLARQLPHKSLGFTEVIACVGWAGLIPDLKLLPTLALDVRSLLLKCLSFSPTARPSAEDAQERFRRIRRRSRSDALRMLAAFLEGLVCQ